MRLVLFGSGAFGLPTFQHLATCHDIQLIVSQPDRPAGRGRQMQPTPISQWAQQAGLAHIACEDINAEAHVTQLRDIGADAWVVIAFGQKLSKDLLADQFAINLHASLLPRYRGAAPINWAILSGEEETGLSVILLADRVDAGDVLGMASTPIEPDETAGELHDRLAKMGPSLISSVLECLQRQDLKPVKQNEADVTHAPKLSRPDATVDFNQSARSVRSRIHGLTPWPGCDVTVANRNLRLIRARVEQEGGVCGEPGHLCSDGSVACGVGSIRLLQVQPPGGRSMDFEDWRRGLHDVAEDDLKFTSS